jgi:hypothetical protein
LPFLAFTVIHCYVLAAHRSITEWLRWPRHAATHATRCQHQICHNCALRKIAALLPLGAIAATGSVTGVLPPSTSQTEHSFNVILLVLLLTAAQVAHSRRILGTQTLAATDCGFDMLNKHMRSQTLLAGLHPSPSSARPQGSGGLEAPADAGVVSPEDQECDHVAYATLNSLYLGTTRCQMWQPLPGGQQLSNWPQGILSKIVRSLLLRRCQAVPASSAAVAPAPHDDAR